MTHEKMMVIDITLDGTAQAMHRDEFPLGFLGRQKIERASEIIFNEDTQLWDIHPAVDCGGFSHHVAARGFDCYDTARKVEVAWFEECRLVGLDPNDDRSTGLLTKVREELGCPAIARISVK